MFYFLLIVGFICACDPEDNRMSFKNNSEEDVFIRMIFFNNSSVERTAVNSKRVNANEMYRIVRLFSWETEFENSTDSILSVVVFNEYKFLNNNKGYEEYTKSDSLLSIGDYKIHQYSYTDLKKKDWQINYPDDGFKKGKPLIMNNKDGESKPKPNPKILKEKGIKDRWNKTDSL